MRRTKIVTTLGPATDNFETLEALILAGANVVRLNFSHGQAEDHRRRAHWVYDIAAKHRLCVAVLADLQGPKIRIARFIEQSITLKEGAEFILDAHLDKQAGTVRSVGIDYPQLHQDCQQGDILLLDDGRIRLEVQHIESAQVHTRVIQGGLLSNNKGINKLGGGLSAQALTDKDKRDIQIAADIGVDYIAVSFPRHAQDMLKARALLQAAGSQAGLIAKIERAEAVQDPQVLDDILLACDGAMVARGDLGVEIGDAQLIGVQKHIISRARTLDKLVITATQMMESMITQPMPTRAEVFDVANAVLDGTDAVMCSAETAAGQYPIQVVKAMSNVCCGAEQQARARISKHRLDVQFKRVDEAIAMSVMYAANHLDRVSAIIALTESGATALWMSRISSSLPIYALTRHIDTQRRVALYRGVEAIAFDVTQLPSDQINHQAIALLKARQVVQMGHRVIIASGDHLGVHGGTNTMKIVTVE